MKMKREISDAIIRQQAIKLASTVHDKSSVSCSKSTDDKSNLMLFLKNHTQRILTFGAVT